MPGLVGLQTDKPRSWAEPQLKRMVESLHHEKFYVSGTWVDESVGLYVGWVSRRHSFSGGLPLMCDQGNTALIFSGDHFSGSSSVQRATKSNSQDFGESSTHLTHCVESEPDFPRSLNGRFHGILADRRRRTATLFNDRYGMHRIYYHEAKDACYFAAEAKAILAVRPELRNIEPRALAEYVTCGCVLENRTLFDGIQVLPNASKWVLTNGSVKARHSYFSPREWEEQEMLDPEQYYDQLRDVFTQNLPGYFQSQERIGISLTGGLDTRMILAWHKAAPRSLPCYTFGGTYRDCMDVVVARDVAHLYGQTHDVITVGDEFLSRFAHYAERTVYLTDGCADVRRASDLYLNECARQVAPVRMTGNYGSEVLRGVRAFKPTRPTPGLFQNDLLPLYRQAEETYRTISSAHPISFAVFKQAPWHHYGLLALEETQVSLRSPYLDNDLVKTVFQAPSSTFERNDLCLRLIADGSPSLRNIPTDRGIGPAGPIGSVLRKWEEFLAKAEYAYDYGMPHWLANIDHMLACFHLERLFLGRHKFNHYRVWYRGVLAQYITSILLDRRTLSRSYLDKQKVEHIVQGHLRGDRNYTNEIHILLTSELLHRLFIDAD